MIVLLLTTTKSELQHNTHSIWQKDLDAELINILTLSVAILYRKTQQTQLSAGPQEGSLSRLSRLPG